MGELKTLSEREIQNRLYGNYRAETVAVEDAVQTPRVVEKREAGPPPRAPKEERRPKIRIVRESSFSKPILPAVLAFLKLSARSLGELLRFLGGRWGRLLLSLDFRKPAVRRTAYAAGGIAFLAGLFAGIHLLNAQREIAMKAPRPPAAASPAPNSAEAVSGTKDRRESTAGEKPSMPSGSSLSPAAAIDGEISVKQPYVIQVATFAQEEDAGRLAERLGRAGAGPRVFVKALSRAGGRIYYCVFIGRFADYPDAESRLAKFKRMEAARPFQDAFIRSLSE